MADQDNKTEAMFMQLVLTFQMAAWQQMGKIKNPITDQIERNLEQARYSIDMLEAIRKKTSGNLGDAEKRLLDHAISELQMNYVDEAQKEKREAENKKENPEAGNTTIP
jgi:F0F1-type ATP synthase membrane subunit b/b'